MLDVIIHRIMYKAAVFISICGKVRYFWSNNNLLLLLSVCHDDNCVFSLTDDAASMLNNDYV